MSTKIIVDIIFLVFLFIYWGFAFLILYHLTRFGTGVQPKRFAAFFLFGSLVLSFSAFFFFTLIDWNSLL